MNQVVVNAILDIRACIGRIEDVLAVRLVFSEQKRWLSITVKVIINQGLLKERVGMVGVDNRLPVSRK